MQQALVEETLSDSSQSHTSKSRQHEAGLVDLGIVILEELLFLLLSETSQGGFQIQRFVLAAYHETNLASGIGSNVNIRILNVREDAPTTVQDRDNQVEMDEMILSCRGVISI